MGGSGCRSEAVHQDVQQAACPGVVFGRVGHGEDADEAGSDVFGGDVGAEFARKQYVPCRLFLVQLVCCNERRPPVAPPPLRVRSSVSRGFLPARQSLRDHAGFKDLAIRSSGAHWDGSTGVEAGRSTTRRMMVDTWRQICASDQLPTVEWPSKSRSTSGMTSSRLLKRSVRRPDVIATFPADKVFAALEIAR